MVINGIDGTTGDYLVPPLSVDTASEFVVSEPSEAGRLNVLKKLHRRLTVPDWGPPFDLNVNRLDQVGWGIVFHKEEDARVKDALYKLVEHRRVQIPDPRLVKVLEYAGETVPDWLARNKVALGAIVPTHVPFYLLLVGSPEHISFEFGHLLDVEYGVGRLHFETPEEYSSYVDSIVDYETNKSVPNCRQIRFFGPEHVDDGATHLSATALVKPLANGMPGKKSLVERVADSTGIAYSRKLYLPCESTKEALTGAFHTRALRPPAVLFTASHGIGWPLGDSRQSSAQGALLCQDYPRRGAGPPRSDQYFGASDLTSDARVHGMVCFHFACYSVGTPKEDRFFHKSGRPGQIATRSMFSALPKALLSHKNGGALGVIGHVERAWPSSIATPDAGPQLSPFENALGYILSGYPLGYCIKDFNERYAVQSAVLATMLEKRALGVVVPNGELVASWTQRNDSEAYVLFGDPAVRVRTECFT